MNKIFSNILLLLIILVLIRHISPDSDSVLFIIKKYLNFIIFKIKSIFYTYDNFIATESNGQTFYGMKVFDDKSPSFITHYQKYWIEFIIQKYSTLTPVIAKKIYHFVENLVTIDVSDFFLSPSDNKVSYFTDNEINTISSIILNKLNSGEFIFSNFKLLKQPKYYNNINGKEVEPFIFTVDYNNNLTFNILIEIIIRNDVKQKFDFIGIKKIRLIPDNNTKPKTNKFEDSIVKVSDENNSENNSNNKYQFFPTQVNPICSNNKNIPQNNHDENIYWMDNKKKTNYKINYGENETTYFDTDVSIYGNFDDIMKNQEIRISSDQHTDIHMNKPIELDNLLYTNNSSSRPQITLSNSSQHDDSYSSQHTGSQSGQHDDSYSSQHGDSYSGQHGELYSGPHTGSQSELYSGPHTGSQSELYSGPHTGSQSELYSGPHTGSQNELYSSSQSGSQNELYSGPHTGSQSELYSGPHTGSQNELYSGPHTGSQNELYSGLHTGSQSELYSGSQNLNFDYNINSNEMQLAKPNPNNSQYSLGSSIINFNKNNSSTSGDEPKAENDYLWSSNNIDSSI